MHFVVRKRRNGRTLDSALHIVTLAKTSNLYSIGGLLGRLNSWVVYSSALIIGSLCHAMGYEFEPWWWQRLFWTQAQHLRFLHDSIWFIWFDTIICLANLSVKFACELCNRRIENKRNVFKNTRLEESKMHGVSMCRLLATTNRTMMTTET